MHMHNLEIIDVISKFQISSRSDLKRRSLRLFKDGRPDKHKKKRTTARRVAIWDIYDRPIL